MHDETDRSRKDSRGDRGLPASRSARVAADAPELGRPGAHPIATRAFDLALADRPGLAPQTFTDGTMPIGARSVGVRTWYPARPSDSRPMVYEHRLVLPGNQAVSLALPGRAVPDGEPLGGETFPVVVLSHGFGGWNTQFSRLAEHIASHGYVVFSIDHRDMVPEDVSRFALAFGNVLLNRPLDQRETIRRLAALAAARDPRIPVCANARKIALIGYSMGGYGALVTGGAAPDFGGMVAGLLPAQACDLLCAAGPALPIDAMVLFAPWGGQPQSRAWQADALRRITMPVLIASGSEDDVVDHGLGVRWLFESLAGTDRRLLTFREARHNIVGVPFDLPEDTPFAAVEFLAEPVWRSDRLNAINQHFVTAFLDLHLKGRVDRRDYLAVPTGVAGAGAWPVAFGEQTGGTLAGTAQPGYWRGFQRRWATGLEMVHLGA